MLFFLQPSFVKETCLSPSCFCILKLPPWLSASDQGLEEDNKFEFSKNLKIPELPELKLKSPFICIYAYEHLIILYNLGSIRTGAERLKPAYLKSFGAGGTLPALKSTSKALFQIKQREVMNSICDPECVLHPDSSDRSLTCSVQGRESVSTLLMQDLEPRCLGEHLFYGREHREAQCCHGSVFQSL